MNKSFTKKWLKSLKEFIRNNDFYNKEIKKENQQVYFIRKPSKDKIVKREDEDVNEYLLFKDTIMKHKDNFDKFIRQLKMSQKNQEYFRKNIFLIW